MQWTATAQGKGAYDFSADIRLGHSRRGYWWVEIGGFRWRGNEGSYQTRRFRLSPEEALLAQAEIESAACGHQSVTQAQANVMDIVTQEA